jgi:N4-(beta-N-acetylglucosaminyl)-L-asparaginase
MFSRRRFLNRTALGSFGLVLAGQSLTSCETEKEPANKLEATQGAIPLALATWPRKEATAAAWEVLRNGGSALDAVEQGVRVQEADPKDSSVGYGGRPDRDGNVTLDACIMDEKGNAGSVCALQKIKHPVSVARKVMEETPHVILVGEGALKFAREQDFAEENLLTEESLAAWKKWLETAEYKPVINVENHDTIGMVAIDGEGNLSGACTTSGLAYKIAGRVGDSPIIGAGLFVDNEVGAATATGMGEAVLKSVGSFLVVELMRQGYSPQEACREAVMRIVTRQPNYKEIQVGYVAVNRAGAHGAYCIQPGFSYTLYTEAGNQVFESDSYLKTLEGK